MPEIAYVALGSNVGDRAGHLERARQAIGRLPDTRIVGESSVEETDPIGPAGQDRYLNQMIAIETGLEPERLLAALQEIEAAGGRERRERWGARTIDLDIVRYGTLRISSPTLTVPHPELGRRDFWRRELAEVEIV